VTKVDQFESVFKAAERPLFTYERIDFGRILLVTDLEAEPAGRMLAGVRRFLRVIEHKATPEWLVATGSDFQSVGDLLALVERKAPDLICTYRHLHSNAWRWPFSLGEHLDILLQRVPEPVVVLPHPRRELPLPAGTQAVMAMTDHLTGDDRLINMGVRFTDAEGELRLFHVEDEDIFKRYMGIIGKLPAIDTETARKDILGQLLKEPEDYLGSCAPVLSEAGLHCRVELDVQMGHRLDNLRALLEEHRTGLVVMNTKADNQLGMPGLSYPLAVELRELPLLML